MGMNSFLGAIPKIPKPKVNDSLTLHGPEDKVLDKLEKQFEKETGVKAPKSWKTKETTEWNKKDLLVYFYARYRETYHAKLSNNIPWQADYATIEDIAVMIQKQLKVEVGIPIMRQYFDWAFESNLINETLTRKAKFTLIDLKRERPVLNFVASIQRGALMSPTPSKTPEIAEPVVPAISQSISLDDLDAAYGIHSQYFIEAFGLLIPVNYLILVKNKSEEESILYVQKAVDKLRNSPKGASKIQKLIETTQKFGPYPKWLPFLDVQKFAESNVSISDDNKVFDSLRSK